MTSYSQIGQDRLVVHLTKEKRCGTFVDIGCSRPSLINNTFLLENEYQWTGLSIDIDEADHKATVEVAAVGTTIL